MLQVLTEQAERMVSQEELLQQVWAETAVTKKSLQGCIRQIREVLGDDVARPSYIETITRQGYRFLAPVLDVHTNIVPPTHFVGRDPERAQLQACVRRALARERQVVFVTGEPGIGKSALVEQVLSQIRQSGRVSIGLGQCLEQYGEGEAFLPILEALSHLCKGSRSVLCRAVLSQYAPSWMLQMSGLLGDEERVALQQRVQGTTRQGMLYELAEGLEALTAEIPLVLVLEDLHWSDYSSIELLSYLAQRREPARLLLIGTYRPGDIATSGHPLKSVQQELSLRGQCQELLLQRLAPSDISAYIAQRFPDNTVSKAIAKTVYERTEGNALFMVNVVNVLASHSKDLLVQRNGHWEFKENTETLRIPDTLQQMIATRLEKLAPAQRRTLDAASLIGREFAAAAVAAAMEQETVQVEEVCTELARQGQFLESKGTSEWPDGTVCTQFGFLHELYREILSQKITAGRRIQLHQRIGERLEAGYGGQCKAIAGELAVHFEQGRDYECAIRYLQHAAENANLRCAYHEAIRHLRRGLGLLEYLSDTVQRAEQELMLQAALGPALLATQGFAAQEVEDTYSRARELCHSVVDTPQLFWVLWGLSSFYSARAERQISYELGIQILALAQRKQEQILMVGAHLELGSSLFSFGNFIEARNHLAKGIALYDPQQHGSQAFMYGEDFGISCFSRMAGILWFLGYPDQAMQKSQQALTLAQGPHLFSLAYALNFAAELHHLRREADVAQEYANRVVVLAIKQDFPIWKSGGTMLQGWALAMQGQAEKGIVQIRHGLTEWQTTGAQVAIPQFLSLLAEAYEKDGKIEEALRVLDDALAVVDKNEEQWWEAELHRLKGELLLIQKSKKRKIEIEAKAEQCFQKGLDVARSQSAKSLELRAAMSLGRLWKQQGRGDEALRMLKDVYNWFTEGLDTADLQEAKTLLRELY